MKKIYYLSTCDTCKRIMNMINLTDDFIIQDIKTDPITQSQIEEMKALAGSFENLFSKRARLYKELKLKEKSLSENDYKSYILKHYTFLKRPVIIYNKQVFIGNSKKTVETAKIAIHE